MVIPFAYSFNWINNKKRTLIGTNQDLIMKYGLDSDQNPSTSLVKKDSSEQDENLEFDEEEEKGNE